MQQKASHLAIIFYRPIEVWPRMLYHVALLYHIRVKKEGPGWRSSPSHTALLHFFVEVQYILLLKLPCCSNVGDLEQEFFSSNLWGLPPAFVRARSVWCKLWGRDGASSVVGLGRRLPISGHCTTVQVSSFELNLKAMINQWPNLQLLQGVRLTVTGILAS